jgi:bifunctional DNA-binding transcriptional regulator/antitoxin component of YhaV-PrlF toxin-antitoxin module
MTKVVNIDNRGTLTLPREARERLSLNGAGQLVMEKTPDGILLRAGVTFPMEIYSVERVEAFQRAEAQLEPYVEAMRTALAKAKAKKK